KVVSCPIDFSSRPGVTVRGSRPHFFFRAEAGIRAFHVTGVQTCALPIYLRVAFCVSGLAHADPGTCPPSGGLLCPARGRNPLERSEERRVGKECSSRRAECARKKERREDGKATFRTEPGDEQT